MQGDRKDDANRKGELFESRRPCKACLRQLGTLSRHLRACILALPEGVFTTHVNCTIDVEFLLSYKI